jgi:hypothetical protein
MLLLKPIGDCKQKRTTNPLTKNFVWNHSSPSSIKPRLTSQQATDPAAPNLIAATTLMMTSQTWWTIPMTWWTILTTWWTLLMIIVSDVNSLLTCPVYLTSTIKGFNQLQIEY